MNGSSKIIAAFALWSFLALPVTSTFAQGNEDYPAIQASVKPGKATVGEPLKYGIVITGRDLQGIEIILPEKKQYFPDKAVPAEKEKPGAAMVPLYIIHEAKRHNDTGRNNSRITVSIDLSFYRPGKQALPELEIRGRDGTRIGYRVPEIVIDAMNKEGEFQEIEPPLDLGGNYYRLLLVSGVMAALAAAGWYGFSYVKRRRVPTEPVLPEIPAIDVFLGEIRDLKRRKLIEEGRAGEFAMQLSGIFRRFLSSQFGTDAMEMTSSDLARFLGEHLPLAVFRNSGPDMRRVFDLWDLAKFAGFAPPAETLRSNMESAEMLGRVISREGKHAGV